MSEVYECRNAGGVLLGWGRNESVVREQAEITSGERDIDTVVRAVEYDAAKHGPSEEIAAAS